MNKRKYIGLIIKIISIFLISFCIISIFGIGIAHKAVFGRIDYDQYDSEHYLLYSDIDKEQYPRKTLQIQSGENVLNGYLYGEDNSTGLIIISPGHGDANDIKLYEITYFVDNDWKVLCYDYTDSYSSQGSSMVGYTQSVHDLDNVLKYVESNSGYQNIPNGHYDYFLSDEALQYQSFIENEAFTGKIDKNLYAQHDISFMKHLNDFLLKAIQQ